MKNQWCRALLKRGSVPRETIKVHDKRLIISDLNEVAGFYYGADLGGVVFHLRDGLVAVLERYALAFCYLTEEELRAGNKLPSPDLWTTLRNTNSIPGCQDRCVRLDIEALWYLPELIHLAKNNIQADNK